MIKVAIVDDKRDIREGIQIILNNAEEFDCSYTFPDGESAIEVLGDIEVDVVLMDIELPGLSGIECVEIIKKKAPDLDVIMFTVHTDDQCIFDSLKAGACGYLTKNTFPSKLLSAIKEVVDGGSPMSAYIARKVVSSFNEFKKSTSELTKREKQVLQLLCKGRSYKVIADKLFVSPNTIRFHLKNIYKKLQVNSKFEAVIKASKENIV